MKKTTLAVAAAAIAPEMLLGKSAPFAAEPQTAVSLDPVVVKDAIENGVRHIVATPCAKVCSRQIDIYTKGKIIEKVAFTRGCAGNALGINALIKGMSVDEAIKRLLGINCASRGTSCPDQLAKVLKSLKW